MNEWQYGTLDCGCAASSTGDALRFCSLHAAALAAAEGQEVKP